jgi:hypothetical protein
MQQMHETTDWRDDLPPIPAERIRLDAIREGTRRRERRRLLQRSRSLNAVRRRRLAPAVGRVDRGHRRWRRRG